MQCFSHQAFVLCSISAPDFCKKRDIYIYAYLFKPSSKKTLFLGAPLPFHILPSILVYAGGSKFQCVNTQTIQFPHFWIPEVWENTFIYIYIYICIYVYYIYICILHIHMYVGVNYFQPFPHILWVAQLWMGFHLAPRTQVDARNGRFFPPNIFLCSISAPDVCKTRHVYSNPFQRRQCS